MSNDDARRFQQSLTAAFWEGATRDVKTVNDLAIVAAAWALVEIALILRDLKPHFILTKQG